MLGSHGWPAQRLPAFGLATAFHWSIRMSASYQSMWEKYLRSNPSNQQKPLGHEIGSEPIQQQNYFWFISIIDSLQTITDYHRLLHTVAGRYRLLQTIQAIIDRLLNAVTGCDGTIHNIKRYRSRCDRKRWLYHFGWSTMMDYHRLFTAHHRARPTASFGNLRLWQTNKCSCGPLLTALEYYRRLLTRFYLYTIVEYCCLFTAFCRNTIGL